MSRIGKKPIAIPKGVTVKVDGSGVDVKGPKGQMTQALPPGITAAVEDGTLVTKKTSDDAGAGQVPRPGAQPGQQRRARRDRRLEARARHRRRRLPRRDEGPADGRWRSGYSHPVVFDIPKGIDVAIEKQTHITVTGVDRQLVGQVAANLRRLRKPDPYQQKGVRYTGEVLKKKAGKTGA